MAEARPRCERMQADQDAIHLVALDRTLHSGEGLVETVAEVPAVGVVEGSSELAGLAVTVQGN